MTRSQAISLHPARPGDAGAIARMSRDLIERGLGWSWHKRRVLQHIKGHKSLVVVARGPTERVLGFAIMIFDEDSAHLALLAVSPKARRQRLGARLLAWLHKTCLVAGTFVVWLEVREKNHGARAFYRAQGYHEVARVPGYYQGREDAIKLRRDLRRRSFEPPAP